MGGTSTWHPRGAGFLRRTFETMMGARERQARRHAGAYLLSMDDAQLTSLGYDRVSLEREIRSLRG